MNFYEYLNLLIPLEDMTPELAAVFTGCIAIACFRIVFGAVSRWFEELF